MPTKNVNLTPALMQFVADEIAAGEYVRAAKQRALLAELQASRAEFDAGKSEPLTRELLRALADDAKKRARNRTTPA